LHIINNTDTSVVVYIHDVFGFIGTPKNTPCHALFRCPILFFSCSIQDPQNYLSVGMGSIIAKFQHSLSEEVI